MSDNPNIVLCTDLDRTLLPNGEAPESGPARLLFHRLTALSELTLVYVSGRDLALVETAINEYSIPRPDYLIADVGTSIYRDGNGVMQLLPEWHSKIASDWKGMTSYRLREQIGRIEHLELQPEEKQKDFKLSYQVAPAGLLEAATARLQERLRAIDFSYNCITSIDETMDLGLVDVLPLTASKKQAVDFLVEFLKVGREQVVFAGDSGNDLDLLVSPYNAVLVANATPEIKQQALAGSAAAGLTDKLYLATGSLPGLNGNYAGGIIEGLIHYYPVIRAWLELEASHE